MEQGDERSIGSILRDFGGQVPGGSAGDLSAELCSIMSAGMAAFERKTAIWRPSDGAGAARRESLPFEFTMF